MNFRLLALLLLLLFPLAARETDHNLEMKAYEQEALQLKSLLDISSKAERPVLPKVDSKKDPRKQKEYLACHEEGRIDRLLGSVACGLGIIVHGDVTQEQLAANLNAFDIRKLLAEGPYENDYFSKEAQQLIYEALIDLPVVYDIHLHNLGYDEGNYVNPQSAAFGVADSIDYFTFLVLRYASGMTSPIGSTQQARLRLQLYAQHFPKLKGLVLPIHKAILESGKTDWKNTGSHLSNSAALKTALTFESPDSDLFPAVSVHPFDPKWSEKLLKARVKGIRLVKWMPPQSIQPDSELLNDYYTLMSQLGMMLIAHAGPEHTIPTNKENEKWVDWGNPLRFRKALQFGVNVILAHCGHKDLIPDLDHPDQIEVPGYQLFLRIAREAHEKNLSGEWTGKLYGDLAAVTTHYGPEIVRDLLLSSDEEGIRLIYGSDYPFTNLIKPRNDAYDTCCAAGLLASEKVDPLNEIRDWNPLLANMVFTRHLEVTTNNGTKRFPVSTFTGEFIDAPLEPIDSIVWRLYKIVADKN